ncbi:MAG TPA: hypothetical protein VNO30_49520 [Kofleriaceae bacterium]|nr:hypothetical protein [Kofleriaceae bacterium]
MKKTTTQKKKRTVRNAKKPKHTATDVKIITEDDLVVVTGGLNFRPNARDQI